MIDDIKNKQRSIGIAPTFGPEGMPLTGLQNDIPTPVSLDYPHRNLTSIVGGIPSAMDVDETKKRINDYFNAVKPKQSISPLGNYFRVENDILNAHINDLISAYKKKNPNASDSDINYKDLIANEMRWPEITKKTVGVNEVDDINQELTNRIYKFFTGHIKHGGLYDPFFRTITVPKDNPATFYHEMGHADNSLYGGFLNNLIHTKSAIQKGEQHSEKHFDPNKEYNNIFEVSDLAGETRHHIPLYLNGKEENAMLLEPFLKAGMQADTTPETNWSKVKKLIGINN